VITGEGIKLELREADITRQFTYTNYVMSNADYTVRFTNSTNRPMQVNIDISRIAAFDNKNRPYYDSLAICAKHGWMMPDLNHSDFTLSAGSTVNYQFLLTSVDKCDFQPLPKPSIDLDYIDVSWPVVEYRTDSVKELPKVTWRLKR